MGARPWRRPFRSPVARSACGRPLPRRSTARPHHRRPAGCQAGGGSRGSSHRPRPSASKSSARQGCRARPSRETHHRFQHLRTCPGPSPTVTLNSIPSVCVFVGAVWCGVVGGEGGLPFVDQCLIDCGICRDRSQRAEQIAVTQAALHHLGRSHRSHLLRRLRWRRPVQVRVVIEPGALAVGPSAKGLFGSTELRRRLPLDIAPAGVSRAFQGHACSDAAAKPVHRNPPAGRQWLPPLSVSQPVSRWVVRVFKERAVAVRKVRVRPAQLGLHEPLGFSRHRRQLEPPPAVPACFLDPIDLSCACGHRRGLRTAGLRVHS